MEHGDRLAKARAEAADGLSRQRDLGHQHAGRATGCEHALDGGEVNLGFAGAGDAVDQHHVAMSVQTGALNLRECLLLAVGKGDRRLAACRGQRGLLAATTPGAALLHHHDAALFERFDGRRHAVIEKIKVASRNRAALQRLDELALTDRGLGRRIVKAFGRKHHPAVLDGLDGWTFNRPHAVVALDHTRAAARGQKQAQALGKRRDILAAHPACDAGSLGGKERFAEDGLDGFNARGVEGVVALQVAQLRGNVHDIARGGTVTKVNQDRGSDLCLVGKGLRDAVSKRFRQRTGGDVEDHARVGGRGLGRRLRLSRGSGRLGLHRSFLRFRRTKQRQLLSHTPPQTNGPERGGTNSTDYFVPATRSSVQKQEPRSGERGSDTNVCAAITASSCGRGQYAPGSRRGRRAPWSRPAGGSPCCRRRRRARPGTPRAS